MHGVPVLISYVYQGVGHSLRVEVEAPLSPVRVLSKLLDVRGMPQAGPPMREQVMYRLFRDFGITQVKWTVLD